MPTTITNHDTAADQIAAHLADRDAFVILADVDMYHDLVRCLDTLDDWTAYVTSADGSILITGDRPVMDVHGIMATLLGTFHAMLFTVPKTVPAAALGKAIGTFVPVDGSKDIIFCHRPGTVMSWPMVFVDAMRQVDPKVAMQLEASELARMS